MRQEIEDEPNSDDEPLISGQLRSDWHGVVSIAKENAIICTLLLVFPFAVASHFAHWPDTATFILSLISIIPLAKLLSEATEELANHSNEVVGALLNASFGNAVELVTAVIALTKASLLGSILSDQLLVLGTALFVGGLRHRELKFDPALAATSMWLLLTFAIGVSLPVAAPVFLQAADAMGRGSAVIFIVIYAGYLIFQLTSNAPTEEAERPRLSIPTALAFMALITGLVALQAEFLVSSIGNFTKSVHVSETFAAVILVPIASNAAEHGSAIIVAWKNRVDLSIGCALGSGVQVGLLIIPVLILVAWPLGRPLTLFYTPTETVILVLSTVITERVLTSGSTHWLAGLILSLLYVIVGLTLFYSTS